MASLKDYFDTDFARVLKASSTFKTTIGGHDHFVEGCLHFDFDANATFISCFVPETSSFEPVVRGIIANLKPFLALSSGGVLQMGLPGERPRQAEKLRFAGRVFIYHEQEIAATSEDRLIDDAITHGIVLQFRSNRFARERSKLERPLAFISHDSRDKVDIARPLAHALAQRMCPVWFDEFSLQIGARLRESVERGLKETNRCIFVITPNFLSNNGWTKAEFNSVFTRELIEKSDVMLPVWHNVSAADVYNYCPSLADRLAAKWSDGEDVVVRHILSIVMAGGLR